MAYTHNRLADTLLKQFSNDIEELTPLSQLFLQNDDLVDILFGEDADAAGVGWYRTMKSNLTGHSYSLFLSRLYNIYKKINLEGVKQIFPRGIPNISGDNFLF
jgi:hypothetical protein